MIYSDDYVMALTEGASLANWRLPILNIAADSSLCFSPSPAND